jgi:hypothetical protein
MYLEGLSTHKIAQTLNQEGVPCNGRKWYSGSFRRIIEDIYEPKPIGRPRK